MNRIKLMSLPLMLALVLSLAGCSKNEVAAQSSNSPCLVTGFVKYKGSYVGDNSAVGNILSMLPAHDYIAKFSLRTKHKPYAITIDYSANQSGVSNYDDFWNSKDPSETLGKNAAVLFALIQNVDLINFNVQDVGKKTYTFTRANVQRQYGDLGRMLQTPALFNDFLNA